MLSKEHLSFEVLLSKMAATIMPFTHAQYCTIFIPSEQTSAVEDQVHYPFFIFIYPCSFVSVEEQYLLLLWWLSFQAEFSRVIHLECEELGSTCQIYRRCGLLRESLGRRMHCPAFRRQTRQNLFHVTFQGAGLWRFRPVQCFKNSDVQKNAQHVGRFRGVDEQRHLLPRQERDVRKCHR